MFVDDNTKKIADEVIGLTKAGVTEIWQKIQQAAPELWKLVIRQKMLDGVELAIVGVLLLVGGIVAIYAARKFYKFYPEDSDSRVGSVAFGIVGGGVGIIGFIACTINAVDFLGNPAYWALKDILELARGR